MLATLRRSGGLEALARNLAVPTPLAAEMSGLLLPLIQGAYCRLCEAANGDFDIAPLLALLEEQGGGDLAVAVMEPEPVEPKRAWALAEKVFGSRNRVLEVAEHAAAGDGGRGQQMAAALPVLTMLVGGYLAARAEGAEIAPDDATVSFAELLACDRKPNPLDAVLPR